ncbi:MAG TPA: protein kinase, partial [Thermoanaerobaculia bacterium]|nr:protein kinase [Thermoanaerobaculia bacterium]
MTATTTASRRRSGLSLETRIFLVTSLLIALLVGAAVVVTAVLLRGIARDAAAESLKSSAAVQETYERERYERLTLISRVFVSDPALVAFIAEAAALQDTASLLDQLSAAQDKLGFDFAILLGPDGKILARTDDLQAAGRDFSRRPLVARALTELEASGVWREGNRLYYAVAVPVRQQFTLLGFLVTGYAITNQSVAAANRVSGADLAVVANGERGPEVVATTLPERTARDLSAAVAKAPEMGRALQAGEAMEQGEIDLDEAPWLVQTSPLLDAEGKAVGASMALASLERELAVFRQIRNVLLAAGLAAVLVAPFLVFAFVRRALAPVRRLVSAAEGARQGNYDQKIDSERTDEVGRLAHAFHELLADLREKRDMEEYVADLSRTLPEPSQARGLLGEAQSRDMLLLCIELRKYARAGSSGNAGETLSQLTGDLERVTSAVRKRRGHVEAVAGHRVLARFEGEGRGSRALAVASQILEGPEADPGGESDAPVAALSSGRAVTGPVNWGDRAERALVGLPVQQLDSLLREAAPGELLLSREVHEELKDAFERSGYRLAPRRGVLSPQPLFVGTPRIAAILSAERGLGPVEAETLTMDARATLSGLTPGALLGRRFEILSVLGAGGMGVVYKARDRELDDLVALKMLKRELWDDRNQLERLKSELKLARKITHPNVLRTFDFGEIDGVPYISMEYVRGVTLRYMLDQKKRLPYSAGLRLAKQLCAGLGAAHSVGVLHSDIKPENMILEPAGNAKLMDFGIARPIDRIAPGQTQAGFIVGTPQYLAPEILQGKEADPRSDLYSTGIVLYEIFAGVLPFEGATAMEVLFKHMRETPPPPSQYWREIPPPLEAAILRCLMKDPDQRYRSVAELLRDLEA